MKMIEGDLLEIEKGVLVHQVNCKGPAGGLAGMIFSRWKIVHHQYMRLVTTSSGCKELLGQIQIVPLGHGKHVCNLFGQYYPSSAEVDTEYWAVRTGLRQVKVFATENNLQVYLPYKFACGLAGGDWNIVSTIIEEELGDLATIVQLPSEAVSNI